MVKLEDNTLLLRLNIKGTRNREVVALKRFMHEDLPRKLKTFANIEEVFEYFQEAENFEIDPQQVTVTVFVFTMVKYKPVKESVALPLQKEKI